MSNVSHIPISAIICTFNRASYINKSIQSLVDQSLNSNYYEIIVVDNNSTDNTKDVVLQQFAEIKNLKYVFEERVGLSYARNTGLAEAQGKYIAYLDDDAIATPNWLENILKAFKSTAMPIGCLGGKIAPIWEAPCPNWLPSDYLSYLTILDWGNDSIEIDKKKYVAGANMAFQADVLKNVGGFNTELGRKGKKLLSSEEVWLQELIRQKGYLVFYDPEVAVSHHVPASRLTHQWFFQRLYWQGVSSAFLDLAQGLSTVKNRFRLIARCTKNLLICPRDYLYFFLPVSNAHRFHRRCSKLKLIGYFWGLVSLPKEFFEEQNQTLLSLRPVSKK